MHYHLYLNQRKRNSGFLIPAKTNSIQGKLLLLSSMVNEGSIQVVGMNPSGAITWGEASLRHQYGN